MSGTDPRLADAGNSLRIRANEQPYQAGLDVLDRRPRVPVVLLGGQVEHPRLADGLVQEDIPRVEAPRGCLAQGAVLLEHVGIALAEGHGDAGSHRALAVAAVGKRLDVM